MSNSASGVSLIAQSQHTNSSKASLVTEADECSDQEMSTRDRLNEHLTNKQDHEPNDSLIALRAHLRVCPKCGADCTPGALLKVGFQNAEFVEAIRFLCEEIDRLTAPVKVSYKLLYEDAKAPAYQTEGASGLDLHAHSIEVEPYGKLAFPFSIAPGMSAMVRFGVAFSIPKGWELQVRPRSSLSKRQVHACLGTIDSDYRGEIGVILINLSKQPFTIDKGDRVAQVVFAPVGRFELERTNQLDETKRGNQGFGSTGKQ